MPDYKRNRSNERDNGRRERNRNKNGERERERNEGKERRRSKSRSKDRHRREKSKSPKSIKVKKPYKFWDVPPVGYENVPVLEYKAMLLQGQVPKLPGTEGPDVLYTTQPYAGNNTTRQSRRLYVGNIPFAISETELKIFFNQKMIESLQSVGEPVIACQINIDKNFAFLEFRSIDECTAAMGLDGIECVGQHLKIKRPRDYQPSNGAVDAVPAENPDKLYIGNLPVQWTEIDVKTILEQFGTLKSFNLVMEMDTSLSKGYAFCEYVDAKNTDAIIDCLKALNSDKPLICNRANERKNGAMLTTLQIPGMNTTDITSMNKADASRVLCLINIITQEQLEDEEDYHEILDDIRTECSKYGTVISLEIPRPIEGVEVAGVGKVFVEFSSVEECQKAQADLAGRKFDGRIVITSFVDIDKYHLRDF